MSSFSKAIELHSLGPGTYHWTPTPDWMQGRTAFGGIVASAMTHALQQNIPAERKLRSLQTSFVGPVRAQESRIETTILREGKNFTQAEARLIQGEQICTIVIGSFGAAHASSLTVTPPQKPETTSPDDTPEQPYIPGMMPSFVQHIAFRWTTDSFPFSGSDQARCQGWFRLRDAEPVHLPGLIALLDAWPPPVLALANEVVRGSSVTWLLNFFADLPQEGIPSKEWWFYESQSTASHEGHADSSALVWSPDGALVARSTQLVVEFSG